MSSRRRFLELSCTALGSAALGKLVVACSSATGQTPAHGPIPGGNVSNMPVGSLNVVPGQPVVLARDTRGLYAMSTICSHLQCDMRNDGAIAPTGLNCYCHGSRYDANGVVLSGPAGSPLVHYAVDLSSAGDITIQASKIVDKSLRTAVPG